VTVTSKDWLAEQFEQSRGHLRAVAFRMLGSTSEADDAVQEAWLRISRSDTNDVENLGGWLTTVVARVCLDQLRSRKSRREEPFGDYMPEPVATGVDPEHQTVMADSVGLALLVVLETLTPAERLAFVLHDMFDVPFDEIGPIVGRSPAAARQLASRARRRVQGANTTAGADPNRRREIVDAFLAALRDGDFEGLLAVLDPDVLIRFDAGAEDSGATTEVRGARAWARQAVAFSNLAQNVQPALINGADGLVFAPHGRLLRALTFTIAEGRIIQFEIITDPVRLSELDVEILND
jgi:RNA polymerase sigma factor (sigma-70 family)